MGNKQKKRKKGGGGMGLLMLLTAAAGILIGLLLTGVIELKKSEGSATTADWTETADAGSTGQEGTAESTPESAAEPETEAPTEETTAPPEETETPQPETTAAVKTVYKTAEELLPVPDSVSRALVSEGGWYGGKFTRDLSTGTVKTEWDRTADIQELLDRYGAIYHKNKDQKVVYLTFDCGGTSSAEDVNNILDILKEKNVKAIFFVPGEYFLTSPGRESESVRADRVEVLRRILEEGHLIGSHSYTHPRMDELSDEDFIDNLNKLQEKLNAALGFDYTLSYYRPPSGCFSERDLYLAEKMGYSTVLWSYAYYDYSATSQPDVAESLEKAKVGLHDGCVYLLHAMSSTNQALLPELIDYALSQGYELRRLDQ